MDITETVIEILMLAEKGEFESPKSEELLNKLAILLEDPTTEDLAQAKKEVLKKQKQELKDRIREMIESL